MFDNRLMEKKGRYLGLRLTGDLCEALEEYCRAEERSLSSAVRYLITKELVQLRFLRADEAARRKTKGR
jgi:hypothetical protein